VAECLMLLTLTTNLTVYPGMSEWLLFNAIKWEQVTFWWEEDDDDVCFVLDQHL
jgi:hypothetical protein